MRFYESLIEIAGVTAEVQDSDSSESNCEKNKTYLDQNPKYPHHLALASWPSTSNGLWGRVGEVSECGASRTEM